MNNVSPIFWNSKQSFSLDLIQNNEETKVNIYTSEEVTIQAFTETELYLDLSVIINTDFYVDNCQINSVLCVAEEICQYPNMIYIATVKIINFESQSVTLQKGEALFSFNIYNESKNFKLINVSKSCFEGMYNDLICSKKLNI